MSITCSVENCRFNDHQSHCTLGDIRVGSCVPNAHSCQDTECDSFIEA
jgi:hypothetical protein